MTSVRLVMSSIAAFLFACTACIAGVDPHKFDNFGEWEFFAGKTSKGTRVCGLSTTSTDAPGRDLSVKQLSNSQQINITLHQKDWRFPTGASIPVTIDFLDGQPLSLKAFGDGQVLDIEIPKDGAAVFLSLMASSAALQVRIQAPSDPRWIVPLDGARAGLRSFVSCAGAQQPAPIASKSAKVTSAESCKTVRFTGLAATRFPYELEDAKKAVDLEDYVARNPILCNKNNSCRGIGFFQQQKARVLSTDGKYLHVMAPVDFTTGRRDIYLAIFGADAKCAD